MLFLNIIIFIFKNTNKYIIDICDQWKNLKTELPYFVFSAANYYSLCITRAVIKRRGPGISPGYYEHGPWLLSSLLFAIQNYFSIHANSPGYVTNLPVSHMGHQISRIKLSYELFCVLILNLSHFLPKFEFSLILSSFSGAFLLVYHQ